MPNPTVWKNFDSAQVSLIAETLPPMGDRAESGRCPSCGAATLRWYSYVNPFRSESRITYVWCSSCKHYYGETTSSTVSDLPDPLKGATAEDRVALEKDVAAFFARLDDLWSAGDLPQVRGSAR